MDPNTLNGYGINKDNLNLVTEWAKDFAISKGILMRSRDYSKDTRVLLPFCLFPSAIPEKWFHLAYRLQPYVNEILFKISHSREFLKSCLSSIVEADEFVANTFRIFETVEEENNEQLSLGVIRSDYLLDCDPSGNITGIKQVEHNTHSASFGGLAPAVVDLHRYILARLHKSSLVQKLPDNRSVCELAKGLIGAWEAYGNPRAFIMFVVEEYLSNICDQKALEHSIVELNADIEILHYTFKDLRSSAVLKDRSLFVNGKEVAVVYYRTGYMPNQYPEKQDWETRLLMERSRAIKCPSAGLHLAGTKTVQSVLTRPGELEKFVDSSIAEQIRQVFVKLYVLDEGEEGDKVINLGMENPQKFVLKPEREGGGNNVYGDEIKTVLENIKETKERDAYILMERIFPPLIPNCIVQRDEPPAVQNVVSEFGVFGVILGNKERITINKACGHLLRSKESFRDETGIAAGFGALDSPLLT